MNEALYLAKIHIAETINRTELLLEWMKIAKIRDFYPAILELFKQLEVLKKIDQKSSKTRQRH